MASHEDFYTSQPSTSSPRLLSQSQFQPQPQQSGYLYQSSVTYSPPSPTTSTNPPPPPPKPSSQETSRVGTPSTYREPPPIPPQQYQQQQPPRSTQSPRPQPPLPTSSSSYSQNPSALLPTQYQQPSQPSTFQQIPPPPLSSQWLPGTSESLSTPLTSHTTVELIPVLSNPALLSALAATHPSHASSLQPLSAALDANIQLAERLAQLETHIESLRGQTQQLLLQHTNLSTQWRRKQSEMDNALSPWGPRAMYQRLISSINEQESLVKAMQESFLEGNGGDNGYGGGDASGGKASEKEVNEWIRRVREGTTVLEKRREMRSRWDEGRVGGWR